MLNKFPRVNVICFPKMTIMNSVITEISLNKQNKKRNSHMDGIEAAICLCIQANFTKEMNN